MWGKVALLWAVFLHVTHCVIPRFPGLRLERLGLWSPFGEDKEKKETLAFFRNSAENANLVLKWTDRMFLAPHVFVIALDLWKNPGGGRGILWISSEEDGQMVAKIKTSKKSLGLPTKLKKIPGPKLTPKRSHTGFPNLKNFQKAFLINNNGAFAAGISGHHQKT